MGQGLRSCDPWSRNCTLSGRAGLTQPHSLCAAAHGGGLPLVKVVVGTALAGPGQHSCKFPLAAAKLTLSQAPKSFFIQTFSDGHGLQAPVGEPGCFPLLALLRPLFQLFTGTDLPKVEAVGAGPMSIPGGHAFHEASLGGPYFSLVGIWPLYLSILSFSAQKSITYFPSSPLNVCYRQTGF